jgi:hypothetical protein
VRRIYLKHARTKDREIKLGEHPRWGRIAPKPPLKALDHRHSPIPAVPYERYVYGRVPQRANRSSATTEGIRRCRAPPFVPRDEALARGCTIEGTAGSRSRLCACPYGSIYRRIRRG